MQPMSFETAEKISFVGDASHNFFSRYMDTQGDGTGTKIMSITAANYYLTPPTTDIYVAKEIVFTIGDDGTIIGTNFGNLAALTSGCLFRIVQGTAVRDLLDGRPIKTNVDLCLLGQPVIHSIAGGSLITVRMTPPIPIRLNGRLGQKLAFIVQDDLSGLTYMSVVVNGVIYDSVGN